ncbi:hypothetical protein [Brucella thiophenivorans]|uniref:hypothetical protein n=1 Tax=Brucella thiophenivorans TaxID=571255 RepID=UPI000B985AF2|nr:hypothetical protein [Brucella thiophenivorans]
MTYQHFHEINSPEIPQKEYRYSSEIGKFELHQDEKDPDKWMNFILSFTTIKFANNIIAHIPNDLPSEKTESLIQRVEAELVQPRNREVNNKRLENLWLLVQSALWLPIALLIVGAACGWAFSGFSRTERK